MSLLIYRFRCEFNIIENNIFFLKIFFMKKRYILVTSVNFRSIFFLTITYLKGPSVQIITIQYVPILHVKYTDQLSIYWIQGCVFENTNTNQHLLMCPTALTLQRRA